MLSYVLQKWCSFVDYFLAHLMKLDLVFFRGPPFKVVLCFKWKARRFPGCRFLEEQTCHRLTAWKAQISPQSLKTFHAGGITNLSQFDTWHVFRWQYRWTDNGLILKSLVLSKTSFLSSFSSGQFTSALRASPFSTIFGDNGIVFGHNASKGFDLRFSFPSLPFFQCSFYFMNHSASPLLHYWILI